jgi:integrase
MAYVNSKKYGSSVQLYTKINGDISYYITYKDETNKLKRAKIGDKSKGINEHFCFQKRNEIVHKIQLGEDPLISKKKKTKTTFKDIYNDYIIWAKGNKKSWCKDEQFFKNHLVSFHNKNVVDIKPKDFEDLKQEKLKILSIRTVEYMFAVARQIINHALKNELIKNYTNPLSGGIVKIPKPDNSKIAFLSKEQATNLLKKLQDENNSLYNLTTILLDTGARFIEIASLNWNDINMTNRLIYFKATKKGNARYVYMSDRVYNILFSLERISNLIFPSSNLKQRLQMPKQWQEIVDELIIGNKTINKYRITTHSLRHTHASWLALGGADILQIKEQLGHKKLDMTLRYAHLIPSRRHDLIKEVFSA